VHIKENPRNFKRFDAVWTPTVIVMDPQGNERYRLEGYLPKNDFHVWLELALGRVAFMEKDWATAEKHFENALTRFPESKLAPEAVYYRGVCRYSATHDSAELANTANQLSEKYSGSEWQLRSIPWLKEKSESTSG
jgi:hypothetical protein